MSIAHISDDGICSCDNRCCIDRCVISCCMDKEEQEDEAER